MTPKEEDINKLNTVFVDIRTHITQFIEIIEKKRCQIDAYGSAINGLALRGQESDLDLSLIISDQKG